MSRAYRITVKESETRHLKAGDEISTCLEILEILPPEDMATLLKEELKKRGFVEQEDGTMARKDGDLTVKIDPCSGEVSVKAEAAEKVDLEARRDATGFNDVGPGENSLRDRVKEQLKQDLDKKFEQEQSRLQTKATEELQKVLKLEPRMTEARYLLALTQLQGGTLQQARATLKEIAGEVQVLAQKAQATHVLFNNNYQDQGQRGAQSLTALLQTAGSPT